MTKTERQLIEKHILIEQLVERGAERPIAAHAATFFPITIRKLFGLEKPKFRRCMYPGCGKLAIPPSLFHEEHRLTMKLGFDPKEYDVTKRHNDIVDQN